MRKFGEAAVLATRLFVEGKATTPQEAWRKATEKIFPNSPSSQEKGCPKGAYLGLCQEGLVRGVGAGEYTTSQDNKNYAVKAVELLMIDPALASDENLLWSKVMNGQEKTPNSQMDVVISLWNEGLIQLEKPDDDQRQQEAVLRYSRKQAAKVAHENPF